MTLNTAIADTKLPQGMGVLELVPHFDERGLLVECFRDSWPDMPGPVQWNLVRSEAGVLRGFHVHVTHADYLVMADGIMILGVKDIRSDSPTQGLTAILELDALHPVAVIIPPGIAHGFCFPSRAVHLYAVSAYWNVDDELGCQWNDPEIEITWPVENPALSPRDRQAGSFADMVRLHQARSAARAVGGEPPR